MDEGPNYDMVNGNKSCFVAEFFSELVIRQRLMEKEYRVMYPRAQEDRSVTFHRYVLNEFIRNSKYTYDTLYKQFHISLNSFQYDIILSETNSFHVYLDAFLRLIRILMEEKDIIETAEVPLLKRVIFSSEIWFFPSITIEDTVNVLLDYCDRNDLCSSNKSNKETKFD